MENELELKHLAPYLPYKLKGVLTYDRREDFDSEDWLEDNDILKEGSVWTICGYADSDLNIPIGEGEIDGFIWRNEMTYVNFHQGVKPILRPLIDLTKEIKDSNNYEFVYVESLEIGDDDSGTEYDHGNIKTIRLLKSIAENNNFHDVQYLPYLLVQDLIKHHFDVFGLIEKGLAIDINTLEKQL